MDNSTKVPQARTIEHFWGQLAQKVYDNGWQATTYTSLRCQIKNKLHEIYVDIVQRTMSSVRYKLRAIADHDPLNVSFCMNPYTITPSVLLCNGLYSIITWKILTFPN